MEETSIEEIEEKCRDSYEKILEELTEFEGDMIMKSSRKSFKEVKLPLLINKINHIISTLDRAEAVDSNSDDCGIEYWKISQGFEPLVIS